MARHVGDLPPGQAATALRRFGLPQFARVRPEPPDCPVVTVTGAVARPTQVRLDDLLGPRERRALRADLHCVTTWSARDLHWEGVPFRDVHAALTAEVGVSGRAGWVVFTGLDGYRACLRLDDALADDVLLADRLDEAPLGVDHGAPVRLVAPAHYGYKNVKHVCAIEYHRDYDPGSAKWAAHPRGRVVREERSRFLPGRLWRPIWRALLPRVRQRYEHDR
ncbi:MULTISPECIES: molybdopterin-dependent oxidoreductase [Saccharothrix]|uniref:molybdopterin-dependent oxidoreductase n=1 Tax=Saccharothrix TaxID=2071 RepID=UPI000940475F|nr:molybdopterin-dependent oxidoreductase [Saccharothrix sp. CB00851]OKI20269.1 molybdopterin-binding oxidoreductase [Saccharothrix sp. CB00851]